MSNKSKGGIQKMENPNYYSVIPAKVRYDNELKANEKLLYGEITALSNKEGYCNARNTYFAKIYGKHKDTIQEWISKLKQKGYIETQIIKNDLGRVEERRIYPIGENAYTYRQKHPHPIGENAYDNITSINNKKEKEEGFKKIIDFYENNVTIITPFVAEDIDKFLEIDNVEADLIVEVIKEAVSRNKRNWKYISTILKNCVDNNIKTANQFRISQEEFKSNKKNPPKEQTEEKIEYEEVQFDSEEEYRKKLFEKQKG